ncbi:hypothetical protein HRbin01_01464 [archaeon HR01]|nr:hypothetical protein HRbin01_01464 [archaeon HR01]
MGKTNKGYITDFQKEITDNSEFNFELHFVNGLYDSEIKPIIQGKPLNTLIAAFLEKLSEWLDKIREQAENELIYSMSILRAFSYAFRLNLDGFKLMDTIPTDYIKSISTYYIGSNHNLTDDIRKMISSYYSEFIFLREKYNSIGKKGFQEIVEGVIENN